MPGKETLEHETLESELLKFDRLERVHSRAVDLFQSLPDSTDSQSLIRPKVCDLVNQFRIVVESLVKENRSNK